MKTENYFVNAQEMHELHPGTFFAPSEEDLSQIKPGVSVKVSIGRERFWVTVTNVDGDEITGSVDNDLIFTEEHGLNYGDIISFKKENVYNIYDVA